MSLMTMTKVLKAEADMLSVCEGFLFYLAQDFKRKSGKDAFIYLNVRSDLDFQNNP